MKNFEIGKIYKLNNGYVFDPKGKLLVKEATIFIVESTSITPLYTEVKLIYKGKIILQRLWNEHWTLLS